MSSQCACPLLSHSSAIVVTCVIQRLGKVEIWVGVVALCAFCIPSTGFSGSSLVLPSCQTDSWSVWAFKHSSRAFTLKPLALPQPMDIIWVKKKEILLWMGMSSVASAGFVELSHWSGGKAKLRDSRSIHSKTPAFTSLCQSIDHERIWLSICI